MSAPAPARPETNEYAAYYEKYVSLVPDADITGTLARQNVETLALLRSVAEERAGFRYEPGKWSIKQVGGHLMDAARLFVSRAFAIAGGCWQALAGLQQV